jgi:hypothetical protein
MISGGNMAKLSAHGTELVRISREYTKQNSFDSETTKYRESRSYRSDGHLLQKLGFWQVTPYNQGWYDWGWKLYKKAAPGANITKIVESVLSRRAELEAKGWTIQLPGQK